MTSSPDPGAFCIYGRPQDAYASLVKAYLNIVIRYQDDKFEKKVEL